MVTLRCVATAEDPQSKAFETVDIIERSFNDGDAVTTSMLDRIVRMTKRNLVENQSLHHRSALITVTKVGSDEPVCKRSWVIPTVYRG